MGRFFLFLFLLLPVQASALDCRQDWEGALRAIRAPSVDPDRRLDLGTCLMRHQLHRPEVAQPLLGMIRNSSEDILLREDLIEAFGETALRKSVRVDEALGPKLDEVEKEAVTRTVASAHDILSVAQAVKSMNETVMVTRYETDFFRTLGEIALDDGNHVMLRAAAVEALEKATGKIVASGVYDGKSVRFAQEALRNVAQRDDHGSFYAGAAPAYERLARAGLPYFSAPLPAATTGRMPASVPSKSQ